MLTAELVGYIEVDSREAAGRLPRSDGWTDIGNLHVAEGGRRQGAGRWLVGQAAEWLQLARLDRVLDYAWPEASECHAFLLKVGFRELTRTRCGWWKRSHQS
jgi:GNAT superfamily N-acetyltransferase